MTTYHFAILRYVHDVSAEEFANIGLAMWMPNRCKLLFRVNERISRLSNFFKNIDGPSYRQMIRNLKCASKFKWASDNVDTAYLFENAANHASEIFAGIVRPDASCFQWSRLMSGISKDAERRFDEMFEELVTFHESPPVSHRPRSAKGIWKDVRHALKLHHLDRHVRYNEKIQAPNYDYTFKMGWDNGKRQVLEPISFALREPAKIIDRANIWSGRLFSLSKDNTFDFTAVVAPPENGNMEAFNDGWAILKGAKSIRDIITEDEVNDFMAEIARDLD